MHAFWSSLQYLEDLFRFTFEVVFIESRGPFLSLFWDSLNESPGHAISFLKHFERMVEPRLFCFWSSLKESRGLFLFYFWSSLKVSRGLLLHAFWSSLQYLGDPFRFTFEVVFIESRGPFVSLFWDSLNESWRSPISFLKHFERITETTFILFLK